MRQYYPPRFGNETRYQLWFGKVKLHCNRYVNSALRLRRIKHGYSVVLADLFLHNFDFAAALWLVKVFSLDS
jgi:hypothetical protein